MLAACDDWCSAAGSMRLSPIHDYTEANPTDFSVI